MDVWSVRIIIETPVQIYPEIKHFVQETLGCSCPEEVFDKISCQKGSDGIPGIKVSVGGRLLIYIITMDRQSDIKGVVNSALERGVDERGENEFNRFRLVLVSSRPDEFRSSAEQAFKHSRFADNKTNLHILHENDAGEFVNKCRQFITKTYIP
jgi:hypothetical protein